MERGERVFRPSKGLKLTKKPMSAEALTALTSNLNRLAELGQAEMARDSGITLPSGIRSTRGLRNGNGKHEE